MKVNDKSLELKKHVGAIHSSNSLSLLQRKIANALLYNAYDELLTKEEHTIHIGALCQLIGYHSNDHKTIKKSLVNLLSTVIEWNLVDGARIEGQGVWNASSMIADASIEGALCTYSYSNKMKQLLYRPELYGRLNMQVQAKFQSNYGLALYENCIRYQNIGQTPWFALSQFRKLMGVEEKKYPVFRDFKRRVLDNAVKEVNQYASIFVVCQLRKNRREVMAVQFLIQSASTLPIEEKKQTAPPLPLTVQLKQEFGFSAKQIQEVLTNYSEEYIQEKIQIIQTSKSFVSGSIQNLAKYILCALKEDYQSPKKSIQATPVKLTTIVENNHAEEQEYRAREKAAIDQIHALPKGQKKEIMKKFERYLKGVYRDIYDRDGLENYHIQRELLSFLRATQLLVSPES